MRFNIIRTRLRDRPFTAWVARTGLGLCRLVLLSEPGFSYVFEAESETVESTVFSPFDLIYIRQMKVEPVWDAFCVLKTRYYHKFQTERNLEKYVTCLRIFVIKYFCS